MSNEPMPSTSIPASAAPGQVPANSPAGVVALPPTITIDDFVKVEFRVATVLEAAPAPQTTVQSPQRWSADAAWKRDYSNASALSADELARLRREFDAQKEIARGLRESAA